jgi:hypothetical protein
MSDRVDPPLEARTAIVHSYNRVTREVLVEVDQRHLIIPVVGYFSAGGVSVGGEEGCAYALAGSDDLGYVQFTPMDFVLLGV